MRILLLNTAKAWGGLESHSIVLAKALLALGQEVILGCRPGANVEEAAIEQHIPVTPISLRNATDMKAISRIVACIRENDIDILAANLGKEYWPATMAAKLAGIKVVLIRHQLDPVKMITKWLINSYVDKTVAVTQAVKDVMLQSGIASNKIAIVHPGQDVQRYRDSIRYREETRQELGITPDDFVVATAGKLHPGKGIYELLTAVNYLNSSYPHIRLLFIGEGGERDNLKTKIAKLGLQDKVLLTGFRSDMDHLYSAMDLFVLPSTTYESFGMVLIEAMATGKPVIGTRLGGIPEIITHGRNGLLVEPGNADDLARAIQHMIVDPKLREEYIRAASQTVDENFTDIASARKFMEVLLTV